MPAHGIARPFGFLEPGPINEAGRTGVRLPRFDRRHALPLRWSGMMAPTRDYAGSTRRRRRAPRRRHSAPRAALAVFAAFAFLLTLLVAAFASAPADEDAVAPSVARTAPAGRPLPQIVAVQGSLRLQLPISQRKVTAIGYHGAGNDVLPLEPIGQQLNEGVFVRLFRRLFGGRGGDLRYYQLDGGEGPSTGGLDVGAPAGTGVYSPVDGTVISIRDYMLNGRRRGDVIDLQPSGAPSVVVSLTRLRADATLSVGSPIAAGSTKLGVLINLSRLEEQALASHTGEAGNHVTVEVRQASTISIS
jgi:hypothetical protein